MPARTAFDGRVQRAALTDLQARSGKTATDLASEVGLSDPQYRRYVWGKLPIRSDQLSSFASAYGVTVPELSSALGFCGEPDLRAALSSMFSRPEIVDSAVAALTRLSSTDSVDALRIFRDIRGMNLSSRN